MKKMYLWLFGIVMGVLSISLMGCDSAVSTNKEVPDFEKITQFKTLPNEQQKIAYSLLSTRDRKTLWLEHLYKIKAQSVENDLTNNRLLLIDQLIEIVKSNKYDEAEKNKKPTLVILTWLEKAKKEFKSVEVYNLVFSQNQSILTNDPSGVFTKDKTLSKEYIGGDLQRDCGQCCCTKGSSFTCARYDLLPPTIQYGECMNGSIACYNNTTYGCGLLWVEACNGDRCVWN